MPNGSFCGCHIFSPLRTQICQCKAAKRATSPATDLLTLSPHWQLLQNTFAFPIKGLCPYGLGSFLHGPVTDAGVSPPPHMTACCAYPDNATRGRHKSRHCVRGHQAARNRAKGTFPGRGGGAQQTLRSATDRARRHTSARRTSTSRSKIATRKGTIKMCHDVT
jgi:hypothetical protein